MITSMYNLMMSVSAVVSAHNEEKYLAGCLDSIIDQTVPVDELIVVNDRSTDRTEEIARSYAVTLYEVDYGDVYMVKRASLLTSRNDLVLAVDGDTRLAHDFIELGLEDLEEGYDAASGMVYPQEPTPMADIASFLCNRLPKQIYFSGPGYVLDRRKFMDLCDVRMNNDGEYMDVCMGREIPLERLNLVKDPRMRMWTELPSAGQKRMIRTAQGAGLISMALRLL